MVDMRSLSERVRTATAHGAPEVEFKVVNREDLLPL
jgi:hypothetical protein